MKNLDKYLFQIQEGFWFSDKTISVDLHKFESGEKDKLLIVGHSGSGKSTLGRKLSKKYKCKYHELDKCWETRDYIKCCYDKIKMSKGKTIVEGEGIFSIYADDYQNIKKFILEQPIIFLGLSELMSAIRATQRGMKGKHLKQKQTYLSYIEVRNIEKGTKIFQKERISQKNSVVKLYKIGKI